MKFFHLSDLHIGKQLYSYSLLENQKKILDTIIQKAKELHPDAVLICGDIYDKSIPSGESYTVLDEFLLNLSKIQPKIPVMIIAGNHDSGERLGYAGRFLAEHEIYISVFPPEKEEERLRKVTIQDEFGEVHFYLLPFLKPSYVRGLFPGETLNDYETAIKRVLERENVDFSKRNVLLSHQFYKNGSAGPEICDSEQVSLNVGGLDSVDVSLVEAFDYVALGHIHGPQKVKSPHIRYCGTPLKYSLSEEKHQKSITMVTLKEKGAVPLIETIPLIPEQDVRRQKGKLSEILAEEKGEDRDFVSVALTDEEELFRPKERLLEKFPFLLEYRIENRRTRSQLLFSEGELKVEDPLSVFRSFYEEVQGTPLSEEEEAFFEKILERAREEV
jgi:exonuclease SbcD